MLRYTEVFIAVANSLEAEEEPPRSRPHHLDNVFGSRAQIARRESSLDTPSSGCQPPRSKTSGTPRTQVLIVKSSPLAMCQSSHTIELWWSRHCRNWASVSPATMRSSTLGAPGVVAEWMWACWVRNTCGIELSILTSSASREFWDPRARVDRSARLHALFICAPNDQAHLPGPHPESCGQGKPTCGPGQVQRLVRRAFGQAGPAPRCRTPPRPAPPPVRPVPVAWDSLGKSAARAVGRAR